METVVWKWYASMVSASRISYKSATSNASTKQKTNFDHFLVSLWCSVHGNYWNFIGLGRHATYLIQIHVSIYFPFRLV